MKQFKNQFTGTGKVFHFTFRQFFKNKGNIISLVLLLLLVLASVPVSTLMGGGSTKKAETAEIPHVYLINDTDVPIIADQLTSMKEQDVFWENTEFSIADFTFAEYADYVTRISETGSESEIADNQMQSSESGPLASASAEDFICVHIYFEPSEELALGSYQINLHTLPDAGYDDYDLEMLQASMTDLFDTARMTSLNISEQQLAILMADWEISTEKISDYLDPEDENKWSTQYFVQFAYAIIVMMVSIYSVSYIVRAVIEEKSSKLVELLMVSVKPLALIVGKILAALAYVLLLFAMLIAGYAVSYFVSSLFLDVSAAGNLFTQIGLSTDLLNTSPFILFIVIFSLLLGFLTFAIFAGLTASGCSTTEDMQGATSGSTFLIMIGYLISIFASSTDIPALNQIVSLFPIVSVFCAPVNYVMGNIGIVTLLLSWVIQIAVIVLLSLFCSRIYVNLLMYRGSRIKFSQMISMAKQSRAGKEER